MILKGNQRSGGAQLAAHLLNLRDNDHVTLHEIRGFIANDLPGAFKEAQSVSQGTRCRQYLFSLSLSPPEGKIVPVRAFEDAIEEIEKKMGLSGQPRAMIFHEKEGRRHAHCVWSRINIEKMRAINLPHYKLKLRDVSQQLFLDHEWDMPPGLINSAQANPLNFTLAQWQQGKRAKLDPRIIKAAFQACWTNSDSKAAFSAALQERGYYLAKGDRRGFVAIDWRGEVYSVSRWLGIRAKEVRAKLGESDGLKSAEVIKAQLARDFIGKIKQFADNEIAKYDRAAEALGRKRKSLVTHQRNERHNLERKQAIRREEETRARQSRLPMGLRALWLYVTGTFQKIKKKNASETQTCDLRDEAERQKLIAKHLKDRQSLQLEFRQLRKTHIRQIEKFNADMMQYMAMSPDQLTQAMLVPSQRIVQTSMEMEMEP